LKTAGRLWLPVLLVLVPLLGGCVATAIAGAAVAVAKAPFQIAGAGVDALTTSQEEADRNRGREARKVEEKAAKDTKKAEKAQRKVEQFQDDEVAGGDPRGG
jgi:ABC-type Na+ efflux pump permease subunit